MLFKLSTLSSFCAITLLFAAVSTSAEAQIRNCETALSRIVRKSAEKAVSEHRQDACSGLKHGPFGIDITEALELRAFELCETGPVVSASITVYAKCATADQATLHLNLDDEVTAKAEANLDTCQVLKAEVKAAKFVTEAGIQIGQLENKAKVALEKEIKSYCK